MKQSKSILAVILSVIFAISLLLHSVCVGANEEVTVTIDDTALSFDVEPQIINGRTLVPLRKIFEELGAYVKWNGETQTVSAKRNSKTVTLTIDSADMQIDKGDTDEDGNAVFETVTLDVPAQIISDRTLVPARAVSEAFGLDVKWDENKKLVSITSNKDDDESWKDNEGKINLSDMTFEGDGIEINGNNILITKGGDYTACGTLENGNITVKTEEKVKLRLDGVSVTSSQEPCIYFEEADKAYITISEGTENTLTSECEKGVIYSKENLEIKGGGTLNINAKTDHGIKASDNLTIENGTINITAEGDGIHINDTFKMSGGILNIDSVGDGIDSESIVAITGGSINIKTNGKSIETENTVNTTDAAMPNGFMGGHGRMFEAPDVEFETSSKGIKAEWTLCVKGGNITVNSADHAIHCADEIEITSGEMHLYSEYGKGISGHGNVLVDGADTVIDVTKSTEGLESKNILTVNNGIINITSSDDGINATGGESGEMMMPQDRNMNGMPQDFGNMPPMPQGEEGFIPGGDMGGMPPQDFGGMQRPEMQEGNNPPEFAEGVAGQGQRPGMRRNRDNSQGENSPENGQFEKGGENVRRGDIGGNGMGRNRKNCLIINGGELTIKSGDDCLDSNGSMTITGGVIKAVKTGGTLLGNNSIFDAEGQVNISAGVTVIAAGSGGTLEIPQNSITIYGEAAYKSGGAVTLSGNDGSVLAEYAPTGDFSAIFISSPDMILSENYTVKIGSNSYDVTLTEQSMVIGTPAKQGRKMFFR